MKKVDKFIFFDVANTLLYKPGLYKTIAKALSAFEISVDADLIRDRHKLLSKIIVFPATTSREFYDYFNSEFLYSLGVLPSHEVLSEVYARCKNLKWKKYSDVKHLSNINIPKGIIGNWGNNLAKVIKDNFKLKFELIVGSAQYRIAKPDVRIFKIAMSKINYQPDQILYVGDSLKLDIEPCSKLGIRGILLDRDDDYPGYLGNKIRSLGELKKYL